MRYAHNRGIEVYWFTWNIFTWGAEGKYGITSRQDNRKTIDYFRASVRELVLAYPLLDGIGIAAGEHMEDREDEFSKEKWLWNTYGRGIVDALKLQPSRHIRVIHQYQRPDPADSITRRQRRGNFGRIRSQGHQYAQAPSDRWSLDPNRSSPFASGWLAHSTTIRDPAKSRIQLLRSLTPTQLQLRSHGQMGCGLNPNLASLAAGGE
ncbi:MAG: hypothetical protein ACR2I2_18715 [Bryobacteraceae bacterium]